MSIELDHIFLLTDLGAYNADLLLGAGLVEGTNNVHPGQGTSNRRFFFKNTTLEILYVHDLDEAINGPAKGLRFSDRSVDADASPFGIVLRTVKGDAEIPFEGWKYCPDYFSSDTCFFVGSNSNDIKEPLCICMPDNLPQQKALPIPENSHLALTELRICVPVLTASKPLLEISKCQGIVVELGKPNRMELIFNYGVQGTRHDFTSAIPLILNW